MRARGFTLIELLIVVAIIAILAAIAVPNFLEAQVRSKVSRVIADMRSVSLAIESYAIDQNGKYSPGQNYFSGGGVGNAMGDLIALSRLTTPIAYMSSIPVDPFFDKNADPNGRHSFTYMLFYKTGGNADSRADYALGYLWGLQSFGPSLTRPYPSPANGWSMARLIHEPLGYYCVYDPSNGSTSSGVIILTNKGRLTGAAYQGLH